MNKFKKTLYRLRKDLVILIWLGGFFCLFKEVSLAADMLGLPDSTLKDYFINYSGDESSSSITYKVLNLIRSAFFPLASTLAILSIIYSGIRMVIADNDEGMYSKYIKQLGWSLWALIIIILANSLVAIFFTEMDVTTLQTAKNDLTWVDLGIEAFIKDHILPFIKYVLYSVAILMTVYSGIMIVTSQDEGAKTKHKKQILYSVIGLATILVLDSVFIQQFYSAGGNFWGGWTPQKAAENIVRFLATNVFDFIKYIIGAIAVLIIILSGMQIVLAGGNEGDVAKHKNQVIWAMVGLVVIIIGDTVISSFYGVFDVWSWFNAPQTSLTGNNQGSWIVEFIMSSIIPLMQIIAGFFALLMLSIAGYKVMMSWENSEEIGKVKTHILWVGIGFGFVLLSGVLTSIFYGGDFANQSYADANLITDLDNIGISSFALELGWIIKFIEQLIVVGAVILLVFGGAKIVLNPGENGMEVAKKLITGAIVALTLVIISSTLITAFFRNVRWFGFYNKTSSVSTVHPSVVNARSMVEFQNEFVGLINWSLGFLSLFCFVLIIYSGMKLLIPSDEDAKLETAKSTILYALLGIAIIITSWTIVNTLIVNTA